jgi:hypothetical protein
MKATTTMIPSHRSLRAPALAWLILGGAAACTPEVIIGSLPGTSSPGTTSASSTTSSSGSGTTSSSGSGTTSPTPACGVTTLASGLVYPAAMAISGDSLYVATDDPLSSGPDAAEIVRVPLAGGDPVVLVTGQGEVPDVVADAINIYWTSSDGTVKKMPASGGQLTVIAAGLNTPGDLAVDATSVYWGDGSTGAVMKALIAGGAPTTLVPGTATEAGAGAIAVDSSNVYWFATGPGGALNAGSVMAVPLGGGTTTTLASGQDGAAGIAVAGGDVYWTNQVTQPYSQPQGLGTVMKVPLDGSTDPVTFASGQLFPMVVVSDTTSVYWGGGVFDPQGPPGGTDINATAVRRAPLLGGAPETIFPSSVISSNGLIVCPGGVCWSDAHAGTVMRFTACSP